MLIAGGEIVKVPVDPHRIIAFYFGNLTTDAETELACGYCEGADSCCGLRYDRERMRDQVNLPVRLVSTRNSQKVAFNLESISTSQVRFQCVGISRRVPPLQGFPPCGEYASAS